MSFVKVDCAILRSSIWWEKTQRDVFITALLMAEPREFRESIPQINIRELHLTGWVAPAGWYGFVSAASIGIIRQAMVEREDGMAALVALGQPDLNSKSKAYSGRRMIRIEGGFIILNYIEYRDRDHTSKERQKRWRDRQKKAGEAKKKTRRAPGTRSPEAWEQDMRAADNVPLTE